MAEERQERQTNSGQAIGAMRRRVWEQGEEIDRLASALVSVQTELDRIRGVCRNLLFSTGVLSAIVFGILIGLIVAVS